MTNGGGKPAETKDASTKGQGKGKDLKNSGKK